MSKYTIEELLDAVKSSTSIRQVLQKLNVKPCGGNYYTFHKLVKRHNIDTSHFTGQGSNKGKTFGPKRPLSCYLNNEYPINSHRLKKRLLAEGVFEHKCSSCGLSTWLNNPIPLELDHINGDHFDNNLKNLRLLCPNCHALTPTYRGKNKTPK